MSSLYKFAETVLISDVSGFIVVSPVQTKETVYSDLFISKGENKIASHVL